MDSHVACVELKPQMLYFVLNSAWILMWLVLNENHKCSTSVLLTRVHANHLNTFSYFASQVHCHDAKWHISITASPSAISTRLKMLYLQNKEYAKDVLRKIMEKRVFEWFVFYSPNHHLVIEWWRHHECWICVYLHQVLHDLLHVHTVWKKWKLNHSQAHAIEKMTSLVVMLTAKLESIKETNHEEDKALDLGLEGEFSSGFLFVQM